MSQHTPMTTTALRLLTLPQAAALLTISVATAYSLARSGKIPAVKIGGGWRVSEAALAGMFERSATNETRTV